MSFGADRWRRGRVRRLVGQRELCCAFLGGDYGLELVDTSESTSEFGSRECVRRLSFSYLRVWPEKRGGLGSRNRSRFDEAHLSGW